MSTVIRYQVKPEYAAENERLVQYVYAELHEANPEGVQYETFVQEDGVHFTHVFNQEGDGPNPILELEAFRRFQEGIADRCEVQPVRATYRTVGSFGRATGHLVARAPEQ